MKPAALATIAQALVGSGKGLLAMDESISTCNRRFAAIGIAQTEEARRAYRELLVTAPAHYAALCQEIGLVPIVEPEVLMSGRHTMQRCGAVAQAVLHTVFDALNGAALHGSYGVSMERGPALQMAS